MAILISSLDASNHLHLHANDSNGTPLISIKLIGVENYRKLGSLSQDVYLGHVFSDNALVVWKKLHETYDRIDGSIPIWRSLLTREILLEVKDAFVIVVIEESHKGIPLTFAKSDKPHASVFVSRTNDNKRNNGNSNSNNGSMSNGSGYKGKYNSLLCKNCDLKVHTIERCFKIIGYTPSFKRNLNLKRVSNFNNNKNNNANTRGTFVGNNEIKTSTCTLSFTNEQVLKLMNLLNDKSGSVAHANMARFLKKRVLRTGSESTGLYMFKVDCDKFVFYERSRKYVFIGYASGKKAYKLFCLENRSVLYYRDVKFYETVFPYKMSNIEPVKESGEISTLNFFDHFESEPTTKIPLRPNDDEEGLPSRDGRVHQPDGGALIDHTRHDGEHFVTPIGEQNHSKGNVGSNLKGPVFQNDLPNSSEEVGLRISQRSSKLSTKLNEFMLDDKVKYGLNNVMNEEMYALYENKTWSMTDLPIDRKPIGCKRVFKIKYKSNGEIESVPSPKDQFLDIVFLLMVKLFLGKEDFGLSNLVPLNLYCDNKSAIHIAANLVMHEKTKHFDIDVHLEREKVACSLIKTVKVDSKCQVADILPKALGTAQHSFLVKKLGLLNMFVL
ncbi:ribonuclease H-like domain-containing protein [Tanacetum coccineum]